MTQRTALFPCMLTNQELRRAAKPPIPHLFEEYTPLFYVRTPVLVFFARESNVIRLRKTAKTQAQRLDACLAQ